MSVDAQTSRNGSQDFQQGSQSVHEGQTRSVGTDTVSNQQLLAEIRNMNVEIRNMNMEIKSMKDSIGAIQLEGPKMEARLKDLITASVKDLTKEATKNKEDLTKEATKTKEDLTKLVTDTEGRLNDKISKVAISYAKIGGGVAALGTTSAAFLAILYRFSSLFEK